MAEERKQKKKIGVGTWIALVLVLVLVVEAGMIGFNVISSMRARGGISLDHVDESMIVEGVSLYDLGQDFVVNNEFLVKLMSLSQQDINAVRLPIDITSHVTFEGGQASLDGQWLWQTASLAEMIFQSEYRVILSLVVPQDMNITPVDYASMWKQVNDAFGHRPAGELWYELLVSESQLGADWELARSGVISSMRAANADRQIILTLPEGLNAGHIEGAGELCKKEKVHLALFTCEDMNEDLLAMAGEVTFQSNVTAILIEPDGESLSEYTRLQAEMHGFGYLLQGD